MNRVLLSGVFLFVLLLSACDSGSDGEPTGTISPSRNPTATAPPTSPSPSPTVAPTMPASFPVELGGIEFQGEPTTGPEWCGHADEIITQADLSVLAGTPWQVFGDGLPPGVTVWDAASIQRCGGREWQVGAYFLVDGTSTMSVARVLRPEPWTQQDSVGRPRDLKVVQLSSREAVLGYSTPPGTTYAWYRTQVDGGWIITRLEFVNRPSEDRILELAAAFIDQDP